MAMGIIIGECKPYIVPFKRKGFCTFFDRIIKIGMMMVAVAAFDAICVRAEAIIHTTSSNTASGKPSNDSSWKQIEK